MKTKVLIASISFLAVSIIVAACFSGCSSRTNDAESRAREPQTVVAGPQTEQPQPDVQTPAAPQIRADEIAAQRRAEAAEAQKMLRSQPEAERQQRIDELTSRGDLLETAAV